MCLRRDAVPFQRPRQRQPFAPPDHGRRPAADQRPKQRAGSNSEGRFLQGPGLLARLQDGFLPGDLRPDRRRRPHSRPTDRHAALHGTGHGPGRVQDRRVEHSGRHGGQRSPDACARHRLAVVFLAVDLRHDVARLGGRAGT